MTDISQDIVGDFCVVAPEMPHPQPGRLVFSGERHEGDTCVLLAVGGQASRLLPLHLAVRKHSPNGFEWGYSGSGPAQLALALCIEVAGRTRAERVYQVVKDALIAPIQSESWMLSGKQVLAAIEAAERQLHQDNK